MVGAFTAIISYMTIQTETQNTELEIANQHVKRIHEEFGWQGDGVCVDTNNNRLFVEVQNLGINAIEFADLVFVNGSLATEPVTVISMNYSDAFLPFGHNGSILLNQPLYFDPGDYEIKLVTTLGIMHSISGGLTVPGGTGSGEFVDAFVESGSGGLNAPEGIVFGPDDNLYVSSEDSHEILRYDGNLGDFIDVFANGGPPGNDCKFPLGIEFGPDGDLYVASEDASQDVICRFDGSTGAFIDYFVTDGLGGMTDPADITFGPDGNLYVTSEGKNSVYRYNGDTGAFIDKFASGVASPKFLLFHDDGNLYVSSESNDKVLKFDGQTGAHLNDFIVPSGTRPEAPEGIIFGDDGHLYVSSEAADEVLLYDGATGELLQVFVF